uniref:ATP synthase F0 subunit 8 n=1 Tax=Calanus hyperboreus TaxID=114069 RepID=K7QLB7_CALHY|nr:ATP synthase F0 subunit 8 [Calanus hyperboreus]AFU88790.1 ATP synthase F0 subunit 8 [Calanus hyperboreus]
MPQMSPMNWFFLFLYFNSMLYMTIVKIYFLSNFYVESHKEKEVMTMTMFFMI